MFAKMVSRFDPVLSGNFWPLLTVDNSKCWLISSDVIEL